MNKINDEKLYLSLMRKTFLDKSWFMSIIPNDVETIIDFGCADNSFNRFLASNFQQYNYIGIENNEAFVKQIRANGDVCFTSIQDLINHPEAYNPDTSLLILNSVVHEIYSYSDPDAFWNDISRLNVKYIAFRDMYAKGCGIYGSRTEDELVNEIKKTDLTKKHYEDFVKAWGKLIDGYTATHFLLKYFYNENWDREVHENYLPYHYRELHTKIRDIGYNVTFERFYGLPFLKDKWHKDFNCQEHPHLNTFINQITTHLKLFMVRGFDK